MFAPHRSLVLRILLTAILLLIVPAAMARPAFMREVVISEIAWMGTTVSATDEWIELYNPTSAAVNIDGWTLRAADGTPNISLNDTIPAHGYYLLERTDDTSVPGVTADDTYTGALDDDGEDLLLRDATSNLIDQANNSAGWFAGQAVSRVPMVRADTTLDGNIPSAWTHSPRCGSATNTAGVSHTCVLTVTNVGHALDYAAYFNERAITATTTITQHTPIEDALLARINGASTQIDVALYGLDRQSVIAALVAAHNRGVTVRVVGDDDAAANEYQVGYQALTNAGLTIVTDTDPGKIQHNKFMVFDGQAVWTGSTNFTDTCLTLERIPG